VSEGLARGIRNAANVPPEPRRRRRRAPEPRAPGQVPGRCRVAPAGARWPTSDVRPAGALAAERRPVAKPAVRDAAVTSSARSQAGPRSSTVDEVEHQVGELAPMMPRRPGRAARWRRALFEVERRGHQLRGDDRQGAELCATVAPSSRSRRPRTSSHRSVADASPTDASPADADKRHPTLPYPTLSTGGMKALPRRRSRPGSFDMLTYGITARCSGGSNNAA
jgi:hypothetical protein